MNISDEDDEFHEAQQYSDDNSDMADVTVYKQPSIQYLTKRMSKIVPRQRMLSYLTFSGNVRFSALQYEVLADAIRTADDSRRLD